MTVGKIKNFTKNMNELEQERLQLAGQVLQGLLERDTGWTSKILDDVFYERLAKHTVRIVDAVLKELKKNEEIR